MLMYAFFDNKNWNSEEMEVDFVTYLDHTCSIWRMQTIHSQLGPLVQGGQEKTIAHTIL